MPAWVCLLVSIFIARLQSACTATLHLRQVLEELLMWTQKIVSLLSENGSRNPFWYCSYNADAGHQSSGTMSSAQLDQFTVHAWLFSFPTASQADQEQAALHLPTCIMNTRQEAARQVQWVRSLCGAGHWYSHSRKVWHHYKDF